MRKFIIALCLASGFGGSAFGSEKCSVAMADWRPREALQAKLEGEGWKVRSILTEYGCYEAYAIDAKGKRIEAFFNPQTFQTVSIEIAE